MDIWSILWVAWIAAFGVIEGVALHRDAKGDTLSEHFRLWFRTDTKHGRTAWVVVSGVFFGWFIVHICGTGLVYP